MIEIYEGDGKGKTTAAAGLALRAAGRGIPVLFVQFLKDGSSGEIGLLRKIPGVEVLIPECFHGFVFRMTEAQKEEVRESYTETMTEVKGRIVGAIWGEEGLEDAEAVHEGTEIVVILDEVLHALHYGLLEQEPFLRFLDELPDSVELVMTGRNPSEEVMKRADYITEMKKIRHPFDRGIGARKGIEQ